MNIIVECTCGARLKTSEKHAGQTGRCPNCGAALRCPPLSAYQDVAAAGLEPADTPLPGATEPGSGASPEAEAAPPEAEPGAAEEVEAEAATESAEPAGGAVPEAAETAEPAEAARPERRSAPQQEAPPPEDWPTIRSWQAHDGPVTAIAFNADGHYLFTAGADRLVKMWDLAAGTHVGTLGPLAAPVVSLAFSAESRRLAGGMHRALPAEGEVPEPNVLVWDLTKRTVLAAWSAHGEACLAVAFSRDGSKLATGGDCAPGEDSPSLSFWEAETGEPLGGARVADRSEVRELVRTPDGGQVAAACWQTITFWSFDDYSLQTTVNSGSWDQFHALALSADDRFVAGGCYEYIRVWDRKAKHTLGHLTGFNADITSLSYATDGQRLVGVSTPEGQWDSGVVMVWEPETHRECAELHSPTGGKVLKVGFVPHQQMIVGADAEGAACLWRYKADQALAGS